MTPKRINSHKDVVSYAVWTALYSLKYLRFLIKTSFQSQAKGKRFTGKRQKAKDSGVHFFKWLSMLYLVRLTVYLWKYRPNNVFVYKIICNREHVLLVFTFSCLKKALWQCAQNFLILVFIMQNHKTAIIESLPLSSTHWALRLCANSRKMTKSFVTTLKNPGSEVER